MALRQKILIVDDDNDIAELISLYLTKECFETRIVNEGDKVMREIGPGCGIRRRRGHRAHGSYMGRVSISPYWHCGCRASAPAGR